MTDHISIGEVLALLQDEFPDITISKIRFLESQGLLDPERTPSGYRKFYDADIERLRWILRQQREHFLPLKVIKVRLQGEDGDESGDEPVPIWMTDLARQAERTNAAPDADTSETEARGSAPSPSASTPPRVVTPLDGGASTVSLNADELARAAGITLSVLQQLEQFGLLAARSVGSDRVYDGDALVVAQKCASFLDRGLEPRHLRMFKVAVEREGGIFEQLAMPLLKQRNPQSREQAITLLGELALLGEQLRAALLRSALHDHLQPH
ncbi:MAG: MerR family DNA-binding transcriptional regulator [Actinomycetota bacterium]|nr:MerR family DNA-binding transcriptional regulator [Actinomycetota bacterium]